MHQHQPPKVGGWGGRRRSRRQKGVDRCQALCVELMMMMIVLVVMSWPKLRRKKRTWTRASERPPPCLTDNTVVLVNGAFEFMSERCAVSNLFDYERFSLPCNFTRGYGVLDPVRSCVGQRDRKIISETLKQTISGRHHHDLFSLHFFLVCADVARSLLVAPSGAQTWEHT